MKRPDRHRLRLALSGLWFRRSTALIVLVLATVASAASVVAPLYSRAAEESIVRDTLRRADTFSLSVQVSVPQAARSARGGRGLRRRFAEREVRRQADAPGLRRAPVAYIGKGIYHPPRRPSRRRGHRAGGRAGRCVRAPADATGRCPKAPGEAMMTRRSLGLIGAKIGDTVEIELPTRRR